VRPPAPRGTAWLASAVLLSSGCADLEPLAPLTCGNGVVEAEVGEDCDGRVDPRLGEALECGSPDAAGQACRYLCDGAECPHGWTCADDGICRAASGAYDWDDAPLLVIAYEQLLLADIVGDAHSELVVRLGGDLSVFATDDEALGRDAELSLPHVRGDVAIADVDGDHWQDLLVPALEVDAPDAPVVVHMLRHGLERLQTAVLPQRAVATLADPAIERAVQVVAAQPSPGSAGEVPLMLASTGELVVPEPSCAMLPAAAVVTTDARPEDIVAIAVRPAASDRPALAAVAAAGASTVELLELRRTCGPDDCPAAAPGFDEGCATTLGWLEPIGLPTPIGSAGCDWWDFDGDAVADLVCHGPDATMMGLAADGTGLGSPVDLTEVLAGRRIESAAQSRACDASHPILLATDLDGDGMAEVVTPHGVFAQTDDGLVPVFTRVRGDAWQAVVAGDFDGDGVRELVASVRESNADCRATRLEHLVPTLGSWTASAVPESALPAEIDARDVDGDGRTDVVAVQATQSGASRVSVFFGDAKEPLEDRIGVGDFADVTQMLSLRSRAGTEVNEELLGDVLVVSDAGEQWTLLTGTSERSLLSPAVMPIVAGVSDPVVTVLGGPLLGTAASATDVLTIAGTARWLLRAGDVHHGRQPQVISDVPGDALSGLRTGCATWAKTDGATAWLAAIDGVAGTDDPGRCDVDSVAPSLVLLSVGEVAAGAAVVSRQVVVPADLRRPRSLAFARWAGQQAQDVIVVGERVDRGALLVGQDANVEGSPPVSLVDVVPELDVWAAAPINADRDDADEIAIVTADGLSIVDRVVVGGEARVEVRAEAAEVPEFSVMPSSVVLLAGSLDDDELGDLLLAVDGSLYAFVAEATP